jgi:hypothetical protein
MELLQIDAGIWGEIFPVGSHLERRMTALEAVPRLPAPSGGARAHTNRDGVLTLGLSHYDRE